MFLHLNIWTLWKKSYYRLSLLCLMSVSGAMVLYHRTSRIPWHMTASQGYRRLVNHISFLPLFPSLCFPHSIPPSFFLLSPLPILLIPPLDPPSSPLPLLSSHPFPLLSLPSVPVPQNCTQDLYVIILITLPLSFFFAALISFFTKASQNDNFESDYQSVSVRRKGSLSTLV